MKTASPNQTGRPPPPPPRDEMESAGEREDDVNAPSLPMTSRPEPRDHHHSAWRGEDHDSLPQAVRATPQPGRTTSTGPASPPAANDNSYAIEELSPTLVHAITGINTSGGSAKGGGGGGGGGVFNERILRGLNGVGPDESYELLATPVRGEPQTEMGSPETLHTTPTEEEDNSPPSPIATPDGPTAGPEGPPHLQDQPVAAEFKSIWDIPGDLQDARSPPIPLATPPDPVPEAQYEDIGIPQPGWQGRMPEVTKELSLKTR